MIERGNLKNTKKKQRMFNTREALAAAFAAHRLNNGYVKEASFDYHKNT